MKPYFDKIVFLDIDGVLNNMPLPKAYPDDFDHENVAQFVRIIDATDAKIVLSSSWRLSDKLFALVQKLLSVKGVGSKLIGRTVDGGDVPRAVEIKEWLSRHHVGRYAILDDDADAGVLGLAHSFFQTKARYGLTFDIADRVIEHLNTPPGNGSAGFIGGASSEKKGADRSDGNEIRSVRLAA